MLINGLHICLLILISIEIVICSNETCSSNGEGGIFGFWDSNETLPTFHWTFDEWSGDPRAYWENSQDVFPMFRKRNDHFQMFGNFRVNAIAYDEGYIELLGTERGATIYSRFDENQFNLAGGFSYINFHDSNQTTACSAFKYQMKNPETRKTSKRSFGVGHTRNSIEINSDFKIDHLIFAPFGSFPVLVDVVTITNPQHRNQERKTTEFSHFEYFDVNRHQLYTEWIRTGDAAPVGDLLRDELNRNFLQSVTSKQIQTKNGVFPTLIAHMELNKNTNTDIPNKNEASDIDYFPPDMFLSLISQTASSFSENLGVVNMFGDQRYFFGSGTPETPEVVSKLLNGTLLEPTDAFGQNAMFSIQTDHSLCSTTNDCSIQLVFVFGYLPDNFTDISELLSQLTNMNALDLFENTLAQWKYNYSISAILPMTFSDSIFAGRLLRESQWRSIQLQSYSTFRDYYETHHIAQGSVYLYGHGADGAARDSALFAMALSNINLELAKETIELMLRTIDSKTGSLSYSYVGHGILSSALGLHEFPSDLDIYLFLAVNTYLSFSGDWEWLSQEIPFYPVNSTSLPPGAKSRSVLDHLKASFVHLRDQVGIGPNGLIKIGDGDWNDDIVVGPDPSPTAFFFSVENGESIPNSQMAYFVLSQTIEMFQSIDIAFANDLQSYISDLKDPIRSSFGGKWFARAWLRDSFDQPYLYGNDIENDGNSFLSLESQVWGLLIPDILSLDEKVSLLNEIETQLQTEIGPMISPSNLVWPAISQWMSAVHSRIFGNQASAFQNLNLHSLSTHSCLFPEQWLGIMSGPDGWDPYAGGTWSSAATPMIDFPIANANPDAMFVFGVGESFGIRAKYDGIEVDTTLWHEQTFPFEIISPVFSVSCDGQQIFFQYTANNDGFMNVTVLTSSVNKILGSSGLKFLIRDEKSVVFPIRFKKTNQVQWGMQIEF